MKLTFVLRFTCLLLLGLMAGGALSFVAQWAVTFDTASKIGTLGSQGSLIRSGGFTSGMVFTLIFLGMLFDLYSMRRLWKSAEFTLVFFALVCIIDEGLMTWSGNLPMNRWFPAMDVSLPPMSWLEDQSQWAKFLYIRSALLVTSFALLLASTFFMKASLSSPISVVAVA